MAQFTAGDHVLADFGDGYVIAHYDHGPVTVEEDDGPKTKHGIQDPGGNVRLLAHREQPDVEASGGATGGTFKSV